MRPILAAARRFGPAALLLALLAAAVLSGATDRLNLGEVRESREALEAFVAARPLASLAIFAALYVAVVTLSIPAALVLMLTGGMLFGALVGGLVSAAAATTGAGVVFLAARTAVGDFLERRAGPAVRRFEEGVRKDAFFYLLTLRLIPLSPFWLINVCAGLVAIPARTFLAATALGVLPGSLIYASLGSGLGLILDGGAEPGLGLLLEPRVFWPLVALAPMALAPVAYRRLRRVRADP